MDKKQEYCGQYKAQHIQMSHSNLAKKEQLLCEVYDNGVILPTKKVNNQLVWGNGGVMDSDGNYVSLSAQNPPARIDYGYDFENPEYCDKKVVYCGFLSKEWGHFLLDCTTRLWYCLRNEDIDEYVFVHHLGSTGNVLFGNYKEFFRLLGILDKVRVITTPTRFKQVYVPELSYVFRCYWSDEFAQVFDIVAERALEEGADGYDKQIKKAFFSRSHFKRAQETEAGLEMLDNFFANNGYAIFFPEEMSLSHTINIIRNADICAFESGTLPHNMMFAKKGQNTVVVERLSVVNNYQCNVDVIRSLNTTYIDGHFTIYPVDVHFGPFYLAYNEPFKKFASDYGYLAPDECFMSEQYKKSCLRKYMKIYRSKYGESLGIQNWHHLYAPAFFESYVMSMKDLSLYLSGYKIYSASQFARWSVIKFQIRRILQKVKRTVISKKH